VLASGERLAELAGEALEVGMSWPSPLRSVSKVVSRDSDFVAR